MRIYDASGGFPLSPPLLPLAVSENQLMGRIYAVQQRGWIEVLSMMERTGKMGWKGVRGDCSLPSPEEPQGQTTYDESNVFLLPFLLLLSLWKSGEGEERGGGGLGDEGGGGTGGRKNKGQKMDWSVLWLNDDRRRREKKFWRRINPELEKGKKVERSLNE